MGTAKQKKRALSSGRPPLSRPRKAALTAVATRTLIRSHHQLNKELHKAVSARDDQRAETIRQQIANLGGIESYQQASILGQSKDRGGDSSIVLMEWLDACKETLQSRKPRAKLLEVGALSTSNSCARSHAFDITHIDLNAQEPRILRQDFMLRPLPSTDDEKFNIISLSLVLNYVPDARQRGAMLQRCRSFLEATQNRQSKDWPFPALFIVLPLPCITNSRYMTKQHFLAIMHGIGYELVHEKESAKLVYTLWRLSGKDQRPPTMPKREVNPGSRRNNFSIVLDAA